MITYPILINGEYKNQCINKVPFSYIVWYFGTIQTNALNKDIYFSILMYFLSKKIRIEYIDDQYYFYFIDYRFVKPPNIPLEFLKLDWRNQDSNGNWIYEIIYENKSYFLKQTDNEWVLSNNIVHEETNEETVGLIYEYNKDYYFHDYRGIMYYGAFLLRKPFALNITEKEHEKNYNNIKI